MERVRMYIDFLLTDPLGIVVLSRLAHAPGVAAVEAERWQKLVSVGGRNIADGQRRGVVRAPQDPELLAAMVLGAVRAAVSRLLPQRGEVDAAQLAQDIWQYQRRGLCLEEEDR